MAIKSYTWLGKPIVDQDHVHQLEQEAAVHEFHNKLPRHEAEVKAHSNYVREQRLGAAAHHLAGVKASQATGDMESARNHGMLYELHCKALGLDPYAPPSHEITSKLQGDSPTRIYKFKPHRADMYAISDENTPQEPTEKKERSFSKSESTGLQKPAIDNEHQLPGMMGAEGYKASVFHHPQAVIVTIHRGGNVVGRVESNSRGIVNEEWAGGKPQRHGLQDAAKMLLDGHLRGQAIKDGWSESTASYNNLEKAQPIPDTLPPSMSSGAPVAGSGVTTPSPTYAEGSKMKPQGQQPTNKNIWVRQTPDSSNKNRTLMMQFSSGLLQGNRPREASDDYYDKLYSNREGYHRPADFWEIPQWQAHLAHSMPEADSYVVRDPEEAVQFARKAGYKNVAFSALDVNKDFVKRFAQGYPGKVVVGGYTDMNHFKGMPNVQVHPTVQSFVESEGKQYRPGYDYRHFAGSKTIPRLTMSDGCRHRCSYCTVPKKLEEKSKEEIFQQADAVAKHLPSDLIYLNDKTFGQAPNHALLPEVYDRIKKQNPNFKGFVVQTTAQQMKNLSPEFLKRSGIKHVELGIESVNNPILKAHKKPANEKLIQEAADKLRASGVSLIPNIMVGLPGENEQTYNRTMDWLRKNRDIVSHVNGYNLAVYDNTDLGNKLKVLSEGDRDENSNVKSWYTNPAVHQKFADDLYNYGNEQLDKSSFRKAESMRSAVSPKTQGESQEAFNGFYNENQGEQGKTWPFFGFNQGHFKLGPRVYNYSDGIAKVDQVHPSITFADRPIARIKVHKDQEGNHHLVDDGGLIWKTLGKSEKSNA